MLDSLDIQLQLLALEVEAEGQQVPHVTRVGRIVPLVAVCEIRRVAQEPAALVVQHGACNVNEITLRAANVTHLWGKRLYSGSETCCGLECTQGATIRCKTHLKFRFMAASYFEKGGDRVRVCDWRARRRRGRPAKHNGAQTSLFLDSRRVVAPAPKVLGPKHISNLDFAPFMKSKRGGV